jgi:hypothetical protein
MMPMNLQVTWPRLERQEKRNIVECIHSLFVVCGAISKEKRSGKSDFSGTDRFVPFRHRLPC